MSDRPDGSVRTGPRNDEAPAGSGAPAAGAAAAPQAPTTDTGTHAIPGAGAQAATADRAAPATGTQAIPTTGSQRAVGASASAAPAAPPVAAPPVAPPPVAQPAPPIAAPPTPVPAAGPASSGRPPSAPAPSGGSAPSGAAPSVSAPAGAAGAPAAAKGRSGRTAARGPRRARLQLRHIDTWSALKISLVLSIALFFIWMVAVGVLYGVLNALGVFDTLNELFGQLGTESGSDEGSDVLTPGVVFGGAAIIGAINIVLLTALCTVGTFIYNMCSDLVGGLELTLSERD